MRMKLPTGQTVEYKNIDYQCDSEPWINIKLSDGNVIKFKVSITEIRKFIGAKDEEGKPVYYIGHHQITVINEAEP